MSIPYQKGKGIIGTIMSLSSPFQNTTHHLPLDCVRPRIFGQVSDAVVGKLVVGFSASQLFIKRSLLTSSGNWGGEKTGTDLPLK